MTNRARVIHPSTVCGPRGSEKLEPVEHEPGVPGWEALPLDVLASVLELLYSYYRYDTRGLREAQYACAGVCRSWRAVALPLLLPNKSKRDDDKPESRSSSRGRAARAGSSAIPGRRTHRPSLGAHMHSLHGVFWHPMHMLLTHRFPSGGSAGPGGPSSSTAAGSLTRCVVVRTKLGCGLSSFTMYGNAEHAFGPRCFLLHALQTSRVHPTYLLSLSHSDPEAAGFAVLRANTLNRSHYTLTTLDTATRPWLAKWLHYAGLDPGGANSLVVVPDGATAAANTSSRHASRGHSSSGSPMGPASSLTRCASAPVPQPRPPQQQQATVLGAAAAAAAAVLGVAITPRELETAASWGLPAPELLSPRGHSLAGDGLSWRLRRSAEAGQGHGPRVACLARMTPTQFTYGGAGLPRRLDLWCAHPSRMRDADGAVSAMLLSVQQHHHHQLQPQPPEERTEVQLAGAGARAPSQSAGSLDRARSGLLGLSGRLKSLLMPLASMSTEEGQQQQQQQQEEVVGGSTVEPARATALTSPHETSDSGDSHSPAIAAEAVPHPAAAGQQRGAVPRPMARGVSEGGSVAVVMPPARAHRGPSRPDQFAASACMCGPQEPRAQCSCFALSALLPACTSARAGSGPGGSHGVRSSCAPQVAQPSSSQDALADPQPPLSCSSGTQQPSSSGGASSSVSPLSSPLQPVQSAGGDGTSVLQEGVAVVLPAQGNSAASSGAGLQLGPAVSAPAVFGAEALTPPASETTGAAAAGASMEPAATVEAVAGTGEEHVSCMNPHTLVRVQHEEAGGASSTTHTPLPASPAVCAAAAASSPGTAAASPASGQPGAANHQPPATGLAGVGAPESARAAVLLARPSTPHVVRFNSKQPHWNPNLRCWCLNFGGRVRLPSARNFQLCMPEGPGSDHDPQRVVLQFGKVAQDVFCLDWDLSLMSPVQALAASLTTFHHAWGRQ